MKPSAKEDHTTGRPGDVTQLLLDWSNGNKEALAELMPVVYDRAASAGRAAICVVSRPITPCNPPPSSTKLTFSS